MWDEIKIEWALLEIFHVLIWFGSITWNLAKRLSILFAGNALIFIGGNNIQAINDKLNQDLKGLSKWLEGDSKHWIKYTSSTENLSILVDNINYLGNIIDNGLIF